MLNQEDLIKKVKTYNPFFNPETLSKAYKFALKAHKDQKRDSGDPYLIHPVAVADILTDLKLDSATIATGLLHDTIEDTHATYETIRSEFGQEVADLVEGVTKISVFENQALSNSKAEIFVTPSTKSATSFPNSLRTLSYVAFVSSIVSCNKPVTIVALSRRNSVSMLATATG